MSFNPNSKKQAQKLFFSRKRVKDCHPSVFFCFLFFFFFSGTVVEQLTSQKHLGIHLDEKLDFNAHMKEEISKPNRGIGIIKNLQSKLFNILCLYKRDCTQIQSNFKNIKTIVFIL